MTNPHKAKQVLDAVVTALEQAAFAKVYRNRTAPVPDDQLPAVMVIMGGDDRQSATAHSEDWRLEVNVALLVKSATTEDLDGDTLALRLSATKALLADPSQGGLVIDTELRQQLPPDFEDGGAFPVGATVLPFSLTYRCNPQNPI